jgi:hypothetical protein
MSIGSTYHGSYNSTVEQRTAMNGVLLVPDPNNSNNVLYELSGVASAYSATPTINADGSISFSFQRNGVTYSFSGTWSPGNGLPGTKGWSGTGTGPSAAHVPGSWTAKT